jgi:hypothetical protein
MLVIRRIGDEESERPSPSNSQDAHVSPFVTAANSLYSAPIEDQPAPSVSSGPCNWEKDIMQVSQVSLSGSDVPFAASPSIPTTEGSPRSASNEDHIC